MKKLFFLGACLVALSGSPVMAQAAEPDIVVVRVYDNGGNVEASISRANGKSEMVKFNGGLSDKGITDSGQGYQKLIARLYQEGYRLRSTFSTGQAAFTTLVFVKGEQP
ncbi:hypothetical protein [Hymenobacter convexus]|uniref:hypothetical protein n=1 Tax=Hymenobacter sp. CA1UV-4 TaxID=3063782 RepID=UPI002712B53F|nr:hypothetical protein [Hymenobacter sp. CA1UV-4]MDO7851384.1 hypothetical protein [Hymenobacter sp. CA1UV-4]